MNVSNTVEADDPNIATTPALNIMALSVSQSHNIGCSYYETDSRTLFVLRETPSEAVDLGTLYTQIQPDIILLPSQNHSHIEHYLMLTPSYEGCKVEYKAFKDFDHAVAVAALAPIYASRFKNPALASAFTRNSVDKSICTPMCRNTLATSDKSTFTAFLSMTDPLNIGCAGAIMTYLSRRFKQASIELNSSGTCLSDVIHILDLFTLGGVMPLQNDTAITLGLIPSAGTTSHRTALSHHSSGTTHCVYNMFSTFLCTAQGHKQMLQLFSRPYNDFNVIVTRNRTIELLLRRDNAAQCQTLRENLRSISDIRPLIGQLRKGLNCSVFRTESSNSISLWLKLRLFAYHCIKVRDCLESMDLSDDTMICRQMLSTFDPRILAQLGRSINSTIDFKASKELHRCVPQTGLRDDLDALRRDYDGLEDLLTKISRDLVVTTGLKEDSLHVIFYPQLGFLISIDTLPNGINPYSPSRDAQHVRNWQYIFSTSDRSYYKEWKMQELDNAWGDIYAKICGQEIEIIHKLSLDVLACEFVLRNVSTAAGTIDCLLALALGAETFNFVKPQMTHDNVIEIEKGWHPLVTSCTQAVIPNDTSIRGGTGMPRSRNILGGETTRQAELKDNADKDSCMMILTGPNQSGKSIYMRQVAIIVYLAHLGSYVPARRATIGLTDQIIVGLTGKESQCHLKSLFLSQLRQVAYMLESTTHRSLLLIDEFANGTATDDGAGLLTGVLQNLLSRDEFRPRALIATHYHEIFDSQARHTIPGLQFGRLEISINLAAGCVTEQIVYLYTLQHGIEKSSFGTLCAALNGIERSIIRRAEYLLHKPPGCAMYTCHYSSRQCYRITDISRAEVLAIKFIRGQ